MWAQSLLGCISARMVVKAGRNLTDLNEFQTDGGGFHRPNHLIGDLM
jgi:hypothetical protein